MCPDPPAPRLEEKLVFLERDVEHLRDQVMELWRLFDAVERRVQRIERGIESSRRAEEGDPGDPSDD